MTPRCARELGAQQAEEARVRGSRVDLAQHEGRVTLDGGAGERAVTGDSAGALRNVWPPSQTRRPCARTLQSSRTSVAGDEPAAALAHHVERAALLGVVHMHGADVHLGSEHRGGAAVGVHRTRDGVAHARVVSL